MINKHDAENLEEHTVDELHRIAAKEHAEVPSHAVKADIIKAIQKNRKQAATQESHPAAPAAEEKVIDSLGQENPAIAMERKLVQEANQKEKDAAA